VVFLCFVAGTIGLSCGRFGTRKRGAMLKFADGFGVCRETGAPRPLFLPGVALCADRMYVVPYLLVKALAYIVWCYLGLRWFRPGSHSPHVAAIALGLGRLALGVCLGLLIFLAALSMNNATRNAPLTYALIYVPVRIFEWSIWYIIVGGRHLSIHAALWIVGGVIISCVADLPIGIEEHGIVPVGRPFC
jgi:hypothetical protein